VPVGREGWRLERKRAGVDRSSICGVDVVHVDVEEGRHRNASPGVTDHDDRVANPDLGRTLLTVFPRRAEDELQKLDQVFCLASHDSGSDGMPALRGRRQIHFDLRLDFTLPLDRPLAFGLTRSGSFAEPVSRFHSSKVWFEILPLTRSSANFLLCAWLLNGMFRLAAERYHPAARRRRLRASAACQFRAPGRRPSVSDIHSSPNS